MPTQIYDASYITFRKRAGVLSGYNAAIVAAQKADYHIVRREQTSMPQNEVFITRKQGGCFCAQDASGISIQANAPGACGCSR
jgi:hypothetical protein